MSKKGKSRSNPMSELHFVAAVQLEEAVVIVGDIADYQHEVTLTEVSDNEFKFRIKYLPNNTKEAEIWGSLQRWQGTETKIDASGYVIRLHDTDEQDQSDKLRNWANNIIIGLIVLFGIPLIIGNVWVCGASLLASAYFLHLYLVRTAPKSFEKSTVSFRARDYLLQRIIDSFKSNEEVEIYVPEITQQEQASGKS